MLIFLAAISAITTTETDQQVSRMSALYEEICLKAFPEDKAVEVLMKARNARELTPDEVKVTMRDDPARGWALEDENATVWIEFPPFHSCSVRFNAAQGESLQSYEAVADKYESGLAGFRDLAPYEVDRGSIRIRAIGKDRILPDRRKETLLVISQHIIDPKRRAAGETGVVIRFVHQFSRPASNGNK